MNTEHPHDIVSEAGLRKMDARQQLKYRRIPPEDAAAVREMSLQERGRYIALLDERMKRYTEASHERRAELDAAALEALKRAEEKRDKWERDEVQALNLASELRTRAQVKRAFRQMKKGINLVRAAQGKMRGVK